MEPGVQLAGESLCTAIAREQLKGETLYQLLYPALELNIISLMSLALSEDGVVEKSVLLLEKAAPGTLRHRLCLGVTADVL